MLKCLFTTFTHIFHTHTHMNSNNKTVRKNKNSILRIIQYFHRATHQPFQWPNPKIRVMSDDHVNNSSHIALITSASIMYIIIIYTVQYRNNIFLTVFRGRLIAFLHTTLYCITCVFILYMRKTVY